MGDPPRTITVKRGVRYNWRESLESILEDGELSKYTVYPSGSLHLHVTRPKNDPRSYKTSLKKKKKKKNLCTISLRIHSARNMMSRGNSRSLTIREQCAQTDCTIPVCFDANDEEFRPCGLRPSSPIPRASRPNKGYFPESNCPYYGDIAEHTFEKSRPSQRDIAVPKTKRRSLPRKPQPGKTSEKQMSESPKQSITQPESPKPSSQKNQAGSSSLPPKDRRSLSPSPSKNEQRFPPKLSKAARPSIGSSRECIPQTGSASSRKNTLIPNESLPSNEDNFSLPKPQEEHRSPSPQRVKRDSHLKTVEHPWRMTESASVSSEQRKSSQSVKPIKHAKTLEETQNPLKPTIGLARLTPFHPTPFQCVPSSKSFTFDDGRREFRDRWETSEGESWDSHVRDRLDQREEDSIYTPSQYHQYDRPKQQTYIHKAESQQKNFRVTLWKMYSSHHYHEPTSKRKSIHSECDTNKRLRRKNGSYVLPTAAPLKTTTKYTEDYRKAHYCYYPSKLTRWPSLKYIKNKHSANEHHAYLQFDTRRDQKCSDISADSSKTNLITPVPNILHKVYSYHEIVSVSEPSLDEMAPNTKLTTANETATTAKVYPIDRSVDDAHKLLLQIKNALSQYFNENCKGSRNIDIKRQKVRELTGNKIEDKAKMKYREKNKAQQEVQQTPSERKGSTTLMGLRYCY